LTERACIVDRVAWRGYGAADFTGRAPAGWLGVALGLAAVLAAQPAASPLGIEDLPRLIAVEDQTAATLLAPELHWSSHGASLVAAGRSADGGPVVVVVPVDGRPAITIPNVVSPRIALSPDGSQVACWLHGPPGPAGAATVQAAVFDTHTGTCAPLPGLSPFEGTSPLVWLPEPERIVALRPEQTYTALAIYDPLAGQPAPLMATVAGVGTVLRKASRMGCVIVGTVGADGATEYFLIDITTGIASNVPPEDQANLLAGDESPLPDGVSPTGGLLASFRDDGLWIGTVEDPFQRHILPYGDVGQHDFSAASRPLWSPTSERLAYTLKPPDSALTQVRIATLGLEEMVCQIQYQAGSRPPAVGATVWVCMALQHDDKGNVIEPEWKTLKAQLSVTSSPVPGVGGMTVRAHNVGTQGGVLKRLTGLTEPPPDAEDDSSLTFGPVGGTPLTVARSFTLPVRHGLIAWSEGASTGTVISVTVTRRALMLFGAPAPQ
jgi:hypothetical protein